MTFEEKLETIKEISLADAFRAGYGRQIENSFDEAKKEDMEYFINRYPEESRDKIWEYYCLGFNFKNPTSK